MIIVFIVRMIIVFIVRPSLRSSGIYNKQGAIIVAVIIILILLLKLLRCVVLSLHYRYLVLRKKKGSDCWSLP